MLVRLLIDAACWTGTTIWCLANHWNVAAAFVGAFGIIYVAICLKQYLAVVRANRYFAQLSAFLDSPEGEEWMKAEYRRQTGKDLEG